MPVSKTALGSLQISSSDADRLSASLDRALGTLLPAPMMATAMMAGAGADDPALPSNIVGVGVGQKTVAGERQVPSIVVLVRHKVGELGLPTDRLVPKEIDGFATSVMETGDIIAQFNRLRRPAPCGVSIGNCSLNMAGTLGCYVRSEADDSQQFVLSNNHVMALVNASPPGAGIPQPGLLDGGVCDKDIIARLTAFVPISFGTSNLVDCAIAQVVNPGFIDRSVLRSTAGATQKLQPPHQVPVLGANVQKSGRTTGYTRGTITLVGVSVQVNMGTTTSPIIARFDQQFQVAGRGMVFSQPGDSGSLVTLDDVNKPVGLLFAGGSGVTFCNDIANVLSALRIAILY
jgi:hypothetical protein